MLNRKASFYFYFFLSSNIQHNSGPPLNTTEIPDELRAGSGLGIAHINTHIILPELNLIRIWIQTTNTDILVLSETWLNKYVTDKDIYIYFL